MAFGKTLFGGSRFIFWALALPLTGFAVVMFSLVDRWTTTKIVLVGPLILASLLLLLALASPVRFRWAGRVVAGMVFLGYLAYAIDMWFFERVPFRLFEPSSEVSPRKALLGLFIIGVPALLYAVAGRFTWNAEEPEESSDERG